jgi:SAM-dependent methyltransferase
MNEQSRTKKLYGLQWNKYRIIRTEEDESTLRLKTGLAPAEFAGKLVLDGGCGMGRYARLAAGWGASVIGMDLSEAVFSATELTSEYADRVSIIRADLLRIPLPINTFDLVYSIGVIDHTPDPRRAFLNLAACVRPGGMLAIWVYEKQSPIVEKIMACHRAVARKLPVTFLEKASRWTVPIGGIKRRLMNSRWRLFQRLGVAMHALTIGVSMHPDPEVRACDTLDWYAPAYVSHHTIEEVKNWFDEAGFERVTDPTADNAFFYDGQGQGVHLVGWKRESHKKSSIP